MKKISLILMIVLAIGLSSNLTSAHASPNPDPDVERVGYVVAYTPNVSITIVDRGGSQFTFALAANLKIVPAHRIDLLKPGAYVTIIAPNNVPGGKWIATGIVIHPQQPNSFPVPTFTFTPLPTETPLPTVTAAPTETSIVTETVTATSTEVFTETPTETATATETLTGTPTGSETPTETATVTATATETQAVTSSSETPSQTSVQSFIDWLVSLLRQFTALNR